MDRRQGPKVSCKKERYLLDVNIRIDLDNSANGISYNGGRNVRTFCVVLLVGDGILQRTENMTNTRNVPRIDVSLRSGDHGKSETR